MASNCGATNRALPSRLRQWKARTGPAETAALSAGSYRSLDVDSPDVFAYLREAGGERLLVALNFGADDLRLDLSAAGASGEVLCSTRMNRDGTVETARLDLRPNEGLLIRLAF